MFIVNIPGHRGEEVWKGKRIRRDRESAWLETTAVSNQTHPKRDHNRVSSHDRVTESSSFVSFISYRKLIVYGHYLKCYILYR